MAETAVVARLKAVLSGDSSQLRRDLDRASKNLESFSKKATQVGRTLTTRVTLPLVGVGVGAVKVAADFEKSMSKITALVGVAADEVASMEGQVRSMATTFGKSATEAADALFYITSAGLRGSTATDTLAASLKASAIGLGDTATIADLATSALNAYGADVISASEATDVMTAAVREGKLEASELAGSMGRVLPLSSAMGVSFNEVGAAFAALSRTGTNAAEAATQIRGILSSLLRPTKQSEEAMAGLGLSAEGLRTQIREEGLLSTLKTLAERFDGNEAAAAAVFGNIRALSGVLDLMGANVATTEQIFANMADTTGTVDEAFSVMSQTASFQFAQAMAEIKESLLTLGQAIMPTVGAAIGVLTDLVRDITGWFKGLDDGTKNLIVAMGGVLAIAGPLALGVGALAAAFSALGVAAAPVSIAIAGISAVAALWLASAIDAKQRTRELTAELTELDDKLVTTVPAFQQLVDTVAQTLPKTPIEALTGQMSAFAGKATLDAALIEGGYSDLFDSMNFNLDQLGEQLRGGTGSLDAFDTAFDDGIQRMKAWASDTATATGEVVSFEEQGRKLAEMVETQLGRKLTDAEQKLVDYATANEFVTNSIDPLIDELRTLENTFEGVRRQNEEDAKAAVLSAENLAVLNDLYAGNARVVIESYREQARAAGITDEYTYVAEKLSGVMEEVARESAWASAEIGGLRYQTQALKNVSFDTAVSLEDMVAGFLAGGEAAGFTVDQMRAVSEQLNGIDGFTAAVGVELDLIGGDAVLDAIDALIKLQMEGMSGLSPDAAQFGFGGALGNLMTMRDALAEALANPDSGGRGGGGGSGASNAVDEVARAAEEAERELQRLIQGVDQFGSSMMGRDFVESLFGGSPDEIADIFENLVSQFDELGMLADGDFASAIAGLGEQFKLAAQKANDLAEATEALAAAQDELERRKAVLADLKDEYAAFRDEFNVSDKQFREAGKKSPLEIALDGIEKNLPKLRDAQNELDRIKSEKGSFEEQVRGMFAPSLSPDTNVMAQTQRILGQAREFRDNLIALRDKGFPPDVIAEVVNAGLAGGSKLGRQLLRMGTGEMSDFLRMREQIAKLGAQTASIAGEVVFGADVANAQGEVDRLVGVVQALYKNAIAEAKKQVDEGKSSVDSLTDALTAATAQMATLVDNIQVNLFNAFNNFLSKLSGEVTTLTTTPVGLSLDTTAIDRLTKLIAKVTDTTPPPSSGGGGSTGGGGGSITPTPAPAPEPEQTYTVKKGDGPIAIIKALTGSTSGWSSKASKLWKHNGLFWNSSKDWQTIHAGQVLRVPALAKGGKARAGMPHLVGEMGAELFVPDSSGYVVPNHALGGGNQTVNVTINTHPGMRPEDIVREIERYTRKRGRVAIPTTGSRRY
ncbi:MAG: phage tail tape measure protein [Ilumatobacteraceae bacterium]